MQKLGKIKVNVERWEENFSMQCNLGLDLCALYLNQ